jgi:hypothetical protein
VTTHAMIDLETLDTTPRSVVLSIGGVKFDPNEEGKIFDKFHFRIDVDEQFALGRTASESTLKWWGDQSKDAINAAFSDDSRVNVDEVLTFLRKWYVGCGKMWAQGVTFDIPIMEDLYAQANSAHPWNFWDVRDSRTLFGILPSDPRKTLNFTAHDAGEDAFAQAHAVQIALKQLNLTLK